MGRQPEYSSKISHLSDVVKIYGDVPAFLESIRDVTHPLLLLYAAHFCLAEVHNGGFLQLFWNSSGILVPESVEGFKALEMPKLAGVFASAAAHLGSSYPRDREERWDALLQASGRTEKDLVAIFETTKDLYLAFQQATSALPLDDLDRQAWALAQSENGGFQQPADAYAATLP